MEEESNQNPSVRARPYDRSEPDPLGNVLSQLFALRGYGRVQGQRQLSEHWQEAVGAETAALTKVLGLKNGVLQVAVANAPLMNELASFRKGEILEAMRSQAAGLKVREIKFKLRGDLQR